MRSTENVEPYASQQKDGLDDKLTFSLYDYVCQAYEQNQDSLGQVQEQDASQGLLSQQPALRPALSGLVPYQPNLQLK
jgi:hypothetical protein